MNFNSWGCESFRNLNHERSTKKGTPDLKPADTVVTARTFDNEIVARHFVRLRI